jgi:hypothetical protein
VDSFLLTRQKGQSANSLYLIRRIFAPVAVLLCGWIWRSLERGPKGEVLRQNRDQASSDRKSPTPEPHQSSGITTSFSSTASRRG